MNKTLKDLFDYDFIEKPKTSLTKSFNNILNKEPDELSLEDICILIRQEMFLDISIPKAIEMIKRDPSSGDNYEYCLLYNLAHMKSPLEKYKVQLKELIKVLEKYLANAKFELESDKKDFIDSLNLLKEKAC